MQYSVFPSALYNFALSNLASKFLTLPSTDESEGVPRPSCVRCWVLFVRQVASMTAQTAPSWGPEAVH